MTTLTNKEAIDKLSNNLVKFLGTFSFLDPHLINGYRQLASLSFAEKLHLINNHLKPHELDIRGFVESELKKYGHTKAQFQPDDFDKFVRFLIALIQAAS